MEGNELKKKKAKIHNHGFKAALLKKILNSAWQCVPVCTAFSSSYS
jgi:hypothetical protein